MTGTMTFSSGSDEALWFAAATPDRAAAELFGLAISQVQLTHALARVLECNPQNRALTIRDLIA